MGSLLKVTKDEVAKRVPGRDHGPVRKAGHDRGPVRKARMAGMVRARRDRGRSEERRKRARIAVAAGVFSALGGSYLFEREKRRREAAKGKLTGTVNSAVGSEVEAPSDQDLADKVRSEVFRPDDAPKGSVNVNVERGVVVLRGEVEDPAQIEQIVSATRSVHGVGEVENLLRTPA